MSDEEQEWRDNSTTSMVSCETLLPLDELVRRAKVTPTPDGQAGSPKSSTPSKKSRDPEMPTMPKTATPMLRMSWVAMSATYARRMQSDLADMMRGARIEAPLHPCWTPYWTVWQGANELQRSKNSTRYGVTLWLELSPDGETGSG